MRTRVPVLFAIVGLALAGCGAHSVFVRVDVLSYLDPSLSMIPFGPVPVVPGGFATGEVAVVEDQSINLVEGLNNVADVQSATLELAGVVVDSTGSGVDTLRVYASAESVDPRTTPPILQEVVALSPGVTDTIHVVVPCDQRVADLFVQKRMRLRVTMSLRGPESGDPLNGRLSLGRMDVLVVADRKPL
jgi:hypothetical protein